MKTGVLVATLLVVPMLVLSAWALTGLEWPVEPQDEPSLTSRSTAYYSGVERTWDAAGDAAASAPASWDPVGVPATGDNITFDGTSVFNANWNVEVTLGNFSMLTGYTGTVTQTADFGCVNYTQHAGTFTGTGSYVLTCQNDWVRSEGLVTANTVLLKMTGESGTLTARVIDDFKKLEITGNISSTVTFKTWTFDNSGTLDIASATMFSIRLYAGGLATTYSNTGTIEGDGTIQFYAGYGGDFDISFGTIELDTMITVTAGADGARTLYIGANTVIDGDLLVNCTHASYTITLDFYPAFEFGVTGELTIDDKVIINQGTGGFSFGSYSQIGVDSVFNQNATVTIGGDFTVSDGVFNALGDMTVPGNWTTTTGDYANDDSAVTLTGASKTLAMNAADSFFNVTVSGTYTMDTDTTVRLRATITGTVDGTGDFLEPEPEFTRIIAPAACPLKLYESPIEQLYWDAISIDTAPYWLYLEDDTLKGIPGENDTGVFAVSVTLTWNDMIVYQNISLIVCADDILTGVEKTILGVVLSLVMGFGLLGLAIWRNIPLLMVFSGLVFMFSAVATYKDINLGWTMLSMGLGMLFLYSGGLQYANDSES